MKSIQKYRVIIVILAGFVFFNTLVMSDSGWVDENEVIYSHVDDMVGINTDTPTEALDVVGNIKLFGRIDGSAGNIGSTLYSLGLKRTAGAMLYARDGNPLTLGGDVDGSDMTITTDGKVGIGTSTPDYELEVNGTIHAEEIIVSTVSADFVFEEDYNLASLDEVEQFIREKGHLPEIPSAAEVEEHGVSLGEMNMKLLQKIEELTLYIIEQEKRITDLEKKLVLDN